MLKVYSRARKRNDTFLGRVNLSIFFITIFLSHTIPEGIYTEPRREKESAIVPPPYPVQKFTTVIRITFTRFKLASIHEETKRAYQIKLIIANCNK